MLPKRKRKEHLIPLRYRPVDWLSQGQQKTGVDRRIVLGQPESVKAVCRPAGDMDGVGPELAGQGLVQRISDPGGAVVPVVVVVIEAVPRPLIPLQKGLQPAPSWRRNLELLHPHRSIRSAIG